MGMSDELNPFDPHSDVRPMNYAEPSILDGILIQEIRKLEREQQDAIRRRMRKGESTRAYERINGVAR